MSKYTGNVKYECPASHAHYCNTNTVNYNLCVNDVVNCNKENYNQTDVKVPVAQPKNEDERNEIQYLSSITTCVEDHLTTNCNVIKEPYTETHGNFNIIPEFDIVTLNVMGLYRNGNPDAYDLMSARVKILHDYIINRQPTILCFQEMSIEFFTLLYTEDIKSIYPHYYEHDYTTEKLKARDKDVEVYVITKIPFSKINVYALEGNLGYTDSMATYEFENLVIINCYLQAGSIKTNGQQYKWLHYSRCRSQQLRFIESLIKTINKPTIILGDFNFNLNEDVDKWPEKQAINNLIHDDQFSFNDSWSQIHPDLPGFTEDTEINSMRFNNKLMDKQYRYDAIFYSKHLQVLDINIILDTPILLDKKLNSAYEDRILISPDRRTDKIKYSTIYSGPDKRYDLFVSDHFGVCGKFRIKPN